jgi:polyphosphate kinase 2 (PPK2 family)
MSFDSTSPNEDLIARIRRDLMDNYDEEYEMELEDRNLDALTADGDPKQSASEKTARRQHFQELFRLQDEFVKLQDCVVRKRHKVVIFFEGRDAAGKGGVIKRITQRLNPRVARVAALPAPSDRERTVVFTSLHFAPARSRRNGAF